MPLASLGRPLPLRTYAQFWYVWSEVILSGTSATRASPQLYPCDLRPEAWSPRGTSPWMPVSGVSAEAHSAGDLFGSADDAARATGAAQARTATIPTNRR